MAHSTPDVVVLDEASLAKRQSIINDACRYLIEIGFPSETFTLKKIHENGYTDKEFLELLDPIYLMQEDREELARLFECINPKNDLGKFLERMELLNTKKGRLPISVALTKMLMKNEEMPQEYVDLAQKLLSSTAALKSTHGNILDQIYDLQRKAFQVDQKLKTKLGPLYGYQQPSTRELRLLSYTLYEDGCRSENIPLYPIHHVTGFDIATNKYGAVAKNLHLLSYLNEPTRRGSVKKHLKDIRSLGFAGEKDCSGDTDPVTFVAETAHERPVNEEEEVSSGKPSDSNRKRAPSTTEQLSDERLPKRTLTNVSEEVSDSKRATSGNEPATTK